MLVFDIDRTLIPTEKHLTENVKGEWRQAFGFEVFMASHLLDFLRERDDIALLSTWGEEAAALGDAFSFKAQALNLRAYSDEGGIQGKFDTIYAVKPAGWADDHITPIMKQWCDYFGVATIIPKRGFIQNDELAPFRNL